MKHKKIFITLIVTAILFSTAATITLDWNPYGDDKITTQVSGIEAHMTDSERMQKADLVIVGNVVDVQNNDQIT